VTLKFIDDLALTRKEALAFADIAFDGSELSKSKGPVHSRITSAAQNQLQRE